MSTQPQTAIIVGNGHRADQYASYALKHPDELKIVGVADPLAYRREAARKKFSFPAERCFGSAGELATKGKLADAIINGTMDREHVPSSLPLLEAGYHMLLEKPFAIDEDEMWTLVEAARRHERKVMICHVLRYAPFYAEIRKRVAEGVIGEVLNGQFTEHVSYHHMGIGFVRGKWRRQDECGSGMLMSKSCHDLDLITWMKSGVRPVRVASYGSNFQFRSEKAPPDAGTKCLVDCPIEKDCLYSARKHYLDHPKRWAFYVWAELEEQGETTLEQKEEFLKGDTIWGRCVWKCDNTAVDHQSVVVEFADGSSATMNMIGGCAKADRSIHLIGTRGEIQGSMSDERFVVRHIDPRPGHKEYAEEVVDLNIKGDTTGAFGGHGGGDLRLVEDFVRVLRGDSRSISCTDLDDSVSGHFIGFCAEQAREAGVGVDLRWR